MATYSSILAWEIPQIEEPGRLQPKGSHRVGHDLATNQQQQSTEYGMVCKYCEMLCTNGHFNNHSGETLT